MRKPSAATLGSNSLTGLGCGASPLKKSETVFVSVAFSTSALGTAQAASLTTAQIGALSTAQVIALETADLAAMTTDQIVVLGTI